MPAAARKGDMHLCPMVTGSVNQNGGAILTEGTSQVFIGGQPAATLGMNLKCDAATDVIVSGSATVLIGGMPAARVGDRTAHGGTIIQGDPTVLIG